MKNQAIFPGPGHGYCRVMVRFSSVLLLAVLLSVPGCRKSSPPADKYNVLLIAVDTLRADHLGCYGYSFPTSPRIDAFAKKCLFFENAFCPIPKTSASFASMMTGLHPSIHKTKPNRGTLNEKYSTLAEILRADGYHTAAVVDNANLSSVFKFNQGFDSYTEVWNEVEEKSQSAPFITARALDFIKSPPKQPFFLWLNYIDPHTPYIPPQDYVPERPPGRDLRTLKRYVMPGRVKREMQRNNNFSEGYYIARYDGAVRYIDAQIGKIIDDFLRNGLDRNTILIITADHGEDLGERNYFFDHGQLTFTASVRVPMLVYIPGRKPATVRTPVSVMDIFPTLLERLKLRRPYPLQGVSLLAPHKDRLLHILGLGAHAVVRNDRHYVHVTAKLAKRLQLPPDHLFDFFRDPRESLNLYGSEGGVAQVLAGEHDAFIKRYGDFLRGPEAKGQKKLTDKERKSLESLGYL